MTRTQAFKNGFWIHSANDLGIAPDSNFYRVAAGHYAWADATSPTTYAANERGLALGVGMVPAAWTNGAGAGISSTLRTQGAFATSGLAGGDLIVQVGSGDGAGRDGSFSVPGNGANSEKFGLAAAAGGARSVAVGNAANAGGDDSVVVGQAAAPLMTGANNVILGQGAAPTLTVGTENVLIGRNVDVSALGDTNATAIGNGTLTCDGAVAIGSLSAATASQQFVCGSATFPVRSVYFDEGVLSATPGTVTFYATGGGGLNVSGGNMAFQPGINTGAGTGGYLAIRGTQAGGGPGTPGVVEDILQIRGRVVPAAFASVTGAGMTAYLRTQDALAASAAQGGDLIFQMGAGDGVGRAGRVQILTGNLNLDAQTASAMLYINANKDVVSTAAPTNGQLLIGSTGANPVLATLTAGAGIGIAGGAGTITISNTGVTSMSGTLPIIITGGNVVNLGTAIAPTTPDANADVNVGMSAATKKFVIQAAAAQSANIFEIQSSDGTPRNAISLGSATVSGAGNTNLGVGAGDALTSGEQNTAIGYNALTTATGGGGLTDAKYNTAVGYTALTALTTGGLCTAVGHAAGLAVTSAEDFTAVGAGAGRSVTTQLANTALGVNAYENGTGNGNTMLGSVAGRNNTGDYNVAVGLNAMESYILVNSGSYNVAVGYKAMYNDSVNLTGSYNVAVGPSALHFLSSGANNTVVGFEAGKAAPAGNAFAGTDNVLAGYRAGYAITSGASNVIIGSGAGLALSTGSANIFLGRGAGAAQTTLSNQFIAGSSSYPIDNVWFGKGKTDAAPTLYTINATGGSGTDIAGAALVLAGGRSTGTGIGGAVVVQASNPAAGTGSGLNNLVEVASFVPDSANPLGNTHYSAGFLTLRSVQQASTTPVNLLVTNSNRVYTNQGAGAPVTFNLPTASVGQTFTFIVQSAQNVVVTASAGDTIRLAANVSAAAGTATSNQVGDVLVLVAINATEWIATSIVGVWNVV